MTRRWTPVVTVSVLLALVLLGAVVGWRTLTAPLPAADSGEEDGQGRCADAIDAGDAVRSREVRVSVFNAGSRSGLASTTLEQLEARGFLPGEVENAPARLRDVRVVRVLAATPRDPAARLVALQFGPDTRIDRSADDLGPGVDVVVGNDYVGLVKAPRRLEAEVSGSGC